MRLERKNSTAFFILPQTEKGGVWSEKTVQKINLCRPADNRTHERRRETT